ncbi:glycosyltransferase family 2 protein [Anaeromyxobacter oryzisoli]|jgi:glycosyltransferase involved in cell wall biosynthesis|uniref:glycosyltransferase family 2 protein n=1 Tax=Anaeromyxobacter oryzisoli TaxID=2925408 RepID=UPI001F57C8DE|nr:glycosyltransferase family 2 protein [Anaeromyxobacter sp. SG63]
MDPISAVVITKNEARNLERCLRSLLPVVDEIVVVDDRSTDDTVAIAERLGARVISQAWLGFGPQKNLGDAAARHRYVLSVDADEVLDEPLQQAILAARRRGLEGAYAVSRLNWYYGRFLRHGLEYPDRKIRLFPRDAASWNASAVHEALVLAPGLRVARLEGHLLHYTYLRLEEHVLKANRYTNLAARDAFERGRRASAAKLVLAPLATFLRAYVLKRGFLDGLHGFLLACMHANGTLLKYAKLRELARGDGPPR